MRVNARPITKPIFILLENQENHYAQDLDSILVVDISEQKSFADLFFIIFIVKIVGNLDVNWIQYNTINFPDLPFSLLTNKETGIFENPFEQNPKDPFQIYRYISTIMYLFN